MRVDAVQTENFRLLQSGRCEFSPGVNVIAGANAQGKTTLLEAVYLLTGAKSFRTYYDKELIAFEKDEEISTHESGGDAFVTCLDGVGRITIDGVRYELHEGESIVMPARHPHAVFGQEQFKMLLVVIF